MFVGRTAELAELSERIAAATSGRGGLLLLSGPAGIGKTRTVEEAVRTAPVVAWGRCVDDPGAPPLWPWRRVMRTLPGVRDAVAGALAGVDGHSGSPEAARFLLVATATEALLDAAEPDGLVVVLEDLHWADEASLRVLRHLAGELSGSRLLVVGTYRDPAGPAGAQLDGVLPDLLRWPATRALPLAPLTEDDVRAYLPDAPAEEARLAHRRSGGNPLYLQAVARAPATGGDAGAELRHLVRTTLTALPPAVLDLLDTAAVLGEEVDAGRLAAVTGRPSEEVRSGLDAAVRTGVLTDVPDLPGRRRFLHAVVRDAIYADLPPSTREELHRRAAEALSTVADPSAAGVVAGHWLRSAADPDTLRRAAAWARRAADAATRSLAFEEAARFLGMALGALRRAGEDQEETAALLVGLAVAEFRAGRIRESVTHAAEAVDAAAGCDRPDLLAEAALAVHDVGSPDVLRELVRMSDQALTALGAEASPAVRSRLLSSLASALADSGRPAAADAPSAEALALAEECGDPEAVIDAVRARMKTAPAELDAAERLRLGMLAVRHAASAGQPLSALWGHRWRIDASLELGDVDTAEREIARISALAAATRLPLIRWHELRVRAAVTALTGDFGVAVALNDAAEELASTALVQDFSAAGMSDAFRLQLVLTTGEAGSSVLRNGLATLADAPPELPIVQVCQALVPLLLGHREEAADRYEQLRLRLPRPDFAASLPALSNLIPLAEAFEDAGTARELSRLLGPLDFAVAGAEVYCIGSARGMLARLAAVEGRLDDAVRLYEEAQAIDERTGARPSVVLDRVGLAGALLRRGSPGDAERAGALARAAAAEARRLGMPGPAERAAELAEGAGRAARAADPLTEREREIAALVAEALTNRQIADRLVLSERTVESHVRNILAKLGLANRTEIATAVVSGPPRTASPRR